MWTLYDSTGAVRTGLDEEEAKSLVDHNHGEGNLDVYTLSDEGERYPEEDTE